MFELKQWPQIIALAAVVFLGCSLAASIMAGAQRLGPMAESNAAAALMATSTALAVVPTQQSLQMDHVQKTNQDLEDMTDQMTDAMAVAFWAVGLTVATVAGSVGIAALARSVNYSAGQLADARRRLLAAQTWTVLDPLDRSPAPLPGQIPPVLPGKTENENQTNRPNGVNNHETV